MNAFVAIQVGFWVGFAVLLFWGAIKRARNREEYWRGRDDVDHEHWMFGTPDRTIPDDAEPSEFR